MNGERAIEHLIAELSALRVRVAHLETELDSIRAHETVQTQNNRTAPPFEKGERVRIINAIKRPANWTKSWNESVIEKERHATVTHTTTKQVWLITDNGTKTWRAHNNVRRITTLFKI